MSEGTPDGDGLDSPDLDSLPGLKLPSADDFMAQEGTADPPEGFDSGTLTVTDLGWPFCLLFNGRPWQTVTWKVDNSRRGVGLDGRLHAPGECPAGPGWGTRQVSAHGQLALVSKRPGRPCFERGSTMDKPTGTLFRTLDMGDMVNALAGSPDSSRIVAGGEGTTVNVWPVGGGDPLARFPVGRTNSVAFSPNGQAIGVADGQQVAVHHAGDGSAMWAATVLVGESVSSVAFSPDGKLVLRRHCDRRRGLRFRQRHLAPHRHDRGTADRPDRHQPRQHPGLAGGRPQPRRQSPQRRLGPGGGHRHRQGGVPAHPRRPADAAVHTAVFTVDGRSVLCSRTDSTCRFFDAATGAEAELSKIDHFAEDLAVDPTGQWLAWPLPRAPRSWSIPTG